MFKTVLNEMSNLKKFTNIFTLSLNPAFDITLWIEPIGIEKINLIEGERKNPAGKGVNVSRTLSKFDIKNKALIVAGQNNKDTYFIPLSEENIEHEVIFVPGYTRENYHIFSCGELVTTMARKGFFVDREVIDKTIAMISKNISENDIVIFGGKFPMGLTKDDFYLICDTIKSLGAKLVLDSNSVDINDILRVKPYLIKPNLAELAEMTHRDLSDINTVLSTLTELNLNGIENIILSMDKDGLIYSSKEEKIRADVPCVKVISSVGAGDSTLAGFIYGIQNGKSLLECVRYAAAFGTASVMSEGTVPPSKEDMLRVYEKTKVYEI